MQPPLPFTLRRLRFGQRLRAGSGYAGCDLLDYRRCGGGPRAHTRSRDPGRHASAGEHLNTHRMTPAGSGPPNPNRGDPIAPWLQQPVTELAGEADLVLSTAALDREAAGGAAVRPTALHEEDDSGRSREPERDRCRRAAGAAARGACPRCPQASKSNAETVRLVARSSVCAGLAGECERSRLRARRRRRGLRRSRRRTRRGGRASRGDRRWPAGDWRRGTLTLTGSGGTVTVTGGGGTGAGTEIVIGSVGSVTVGRLSVGSRGGLWPEAVAVQKPSTAITAQSAPRQIK